MTYLSRRRLYKVLIHRGRRLRDRCREPAEALGQGRDGIFLQVLKLGQALLLLRRGRVAEPSVFAALARMQVL